MSEWFDISTAPLDGTPVWLIDNELSEGTMFIGYWFQGSDGGFWTNGAAIHKEGRFGTRISGGVYSNKARFTPKLWQPLPEPPKQEER